VPGGTLIETLASVAVLAVVNVYVYVTPVAPLAAFETAQPTEARVPPEIATPAVTPVSTGVLLVFVAICDVYVPVVVVFVSPPMSRLTAVPAFRYVAVKL
jgi:hypothetical protein